MKKHYKFLLLSLLAFIAVNVVLAQSPEQFKYQAVLRDATGNIIPNTAKTVIINILQGSSTGTSVYQETHSVTTTAQGVINLNIGGGTVNAGVFANINWCANPYWVKVTVDGTVISTGQLLSVPYSLNVKGINVVSGNVGIGTTTPAAKLHVKGFVQLEGNPDAQILFGTTGANGKRGIGSLAGWDANALYINGWGDFTTGVSVGHWGGSETSNLYVNGAINATSMLVNGVPVATTANTFWNGGAGNTINYTAGNVGIGTLTPGYTLDVNGVIHSAIDNGECFRIGNDMTLQDINISNHVGLYGVQDPTVGSIKLGSGGGIISGKNNYIGIGTIAPTSKVHVVGSDPRTNLLVESNSTTFGPELRLNSTAASGHEWRIVSGASASNPYGAGSFELWDQTAAASRFGITANGNVGIGTTTPAAKLHVAGTVRIADGTQGANKVLTSDASGNASWVTNTGITPAVVASLSSTSYNLTNTAGQYTGSYITLPAGKWSVQINMLLNSDASSLWMRSGFSSSTSSYITSPDIIGASLASGYKAANCYGMLIGTIIINNTSGSPKTYYYWSTNIAMYSGSLNLSNFGTSLWMEDQIIAYPMN